VDVTEWAPATDAEVAMRDALRTDDQESYFRILAGVDLLLPVSADALAGLAPLGWGTWSTGGRTHVLAFTSPAALQACLADYTGSARRVAYAELADTWPNLEWWLAVNPGLPIEGYLPAWFVAQLSRGDLRLPTRGPAREAGKGVPQSPDLQAAVMAANATAAQAPPAAADQPGFSAVGVSAGDPGHGSAQSGGSSFGPADAPAFAGPAAAPAGPRFGGPGAGGIENEASRFSDSPERRTGPDLGNRRGGGGEPRLDELRRGTPADRPAAPAAGADSSAAGADAPVGPGGLPVRTPGGVLPSGLPSRVPSTPASGPDTSSFPGFGTRGDGAEASGSSVPAAYRSPGIPGNAPASAAPGSPVPAAYRPPGVPGGAPPATTGATPGQGSTSAAADRSAIGAALGRGPIGSNPGRGGVGATFDRGPSADNADRGAPAAENAGAGTASLQDPGGTLPTRTPMAQTPPLPSHIPPPDGGPDRQPADGLPRRPMTPPSERPPSMAAAAQALAGARTPQPAAPSGIMPPVIPGAGGPTRTSMRSDLPNTPPPYAAAPPPTSRPEPAGPQTPVGDEFVPANDVERDLLDAAGEHSTDRFLSTLLLATVLVPVEHDSRPGSSPGESGFVFRTEEVDGERFLVVFTSRDRLAEHFDEPTRTVGVRFYELIRNWPDPAWSFAVNPESPVGAKYPGPQVIALASWAADAGLGADPAEADERAIAPVPAPQKVNDSAQHATVMQKTVPAEQVDYYLERGYDRVGGFVHRANEVEHLRTPADLFGALGLVHDGSSYQADAKEAYVLRWPAYRPSLYRIPYGGQSEQALRAMDGWVIERPPFRGNGFAPGEGRDVIAEFKVDSVRLPHGAQLWRMDGDGTERMVAVFDADVTTWRRVGEQ
jgi:SseB protein N-terminal domain